MKKVALSVFVLFVLGGCSKQEYTADYLFEHDDIRKQVLLDCENNKQSESTCKNAREAKARKFNTSQNKEPIKTKAIN